MKQLFYRILAIFLVVLGVIGIFLPVMPTVPFLLAALYFAADAPEIKRFIYHNRLLSKYLECYQEKRKVSKFMKYGMLTTLWISLGISWFWVDWWWCRAILLIVGFAVSWHLMRLKSF